MTEAGSYNLRAVRKLVTTVYTLEEIRQLCYEVPAFRPVYDNFSEDRKEVLVRHLIEHCERKGLLPQLLALVAEDVPERYNEFANQLGGESGSGFPSLPTVPPGSASPAEAEQLRQIITEKQRYLHQLRLKQAKYGPLSTPPEIVLQIEDLEQELADLEQRYNFLVGKK